MIGMLLGPLLDRLERGHVQIVLLLAGAALIALAIYLPHHRVNVVKALV